jgi:hypothetical protein
MIAFMKEAGQTEKLQPKTQNLKPALTLPGESDKVVYR